MTGQTTARAAGGSEPTEVYTASDLIFGGGKVYSFPKADFIRLWWNTDGTDTSLAFFPGDKAYVIWGTVIGYGQLNADGDTLTFEDKSGGIAGCTLKAYKF